MPVGTPVSALDEALATLEQLKIMLRNDPASVKKYYSGMHDSLRIFLNRRLGLVTMEKTSEELILILNRFAFAQGRFFQTDCSPAHGGFCKVCEIYSRPL